MIYFMKKKDWIYILLILVVSIVVMLPKILSNYQVNDDTEFHVSNTLATLKTMDDWVPDDILPDLAGNYGYATRQFYPVLAHTTTAYTMKIFNLDVTTTFKIVHTLVLFLSGVAMYFLAKRYLKKDYLAFTSAIIYMLLPYHLTDIYVRDALAECFLFIFLPIILNGLTYLFEDKRKFLLLFVLGYVGGMLSHLTLMVYFTVLLIPFFIIYRKKVFKKETIITLIEAAVLILGIMSPVIVNMFQNKLEGNFEVFVPGVMAQGIQHSGLWLDLINYFGIFHGGIFDKIVQNGITSKYYIDIIVLILFIIVIKKRKQIDFSNYKFMIIFGLLSLLMSSIIFPWDLLPQGFRIIQFPWRLETFFGIALAIIAPLAIDKIKINYKYLCGGMIILALIFNTSSPRDVFDINKLNYERGMGWQLEYLPVNTFNHWDELKNREYKIITDNGTATITSDKTTDLCFNVSEDTQIVIPRIDYLGYYLMDENGNNVNINSSDEGLISASVTKGSYELVYKGTKIVRISYVISLVTIIILITYLVVSKRKAQIEKVDK